MLLLCEWVLGMNSYTGANTRDSLLCDLVKSYAGSGEGGKVVVMKMLGMWGGGGCE